MLACVEVTCDGRFLYFLLVAFAWDIACLNVVLGSAPFKFAYTDFTWSVHLGVFEGTEGLDTGSVAGLDMGSAGRSTNDVGRSRKDESFVGRKDICKLVHS